MAVDQEWFIRKFENLTISDPREEILNEINVALCGLPFSSVKQIAAILRFDSVFDSLNTSSESQIAVTCDILAKLLPATEPTRVLTQYGSFVQHALSHPTIRVKEVILRELNLIADQPEMIQRVCQEKDLIIGIIECLTSEMSVAQQAINILTKLGENPVGLNVIYNPTNLKALKQVMTKDDTVRFRVYEVVVNISIKTPEGLQASVASELLPMFLEELKQNDVLITLTALSLLTPLALVPSGLAFLDQNGVLDDLESSLGTVQDDPLGSILLPGIVKFFGNIAQIRPEEVIPRFPKVVSVVFETVQSNDPTQVAIAMETIGYIATTNKGKYALQQLGNKVPSALQIAREKMPALSSDVKVRVLNSFANILRLEPDEITNQSESLTSSWARALHPQPIDYIVSLTNQPFPEIRLAGLKMLQAVAVQRWGQELIVNTPGVVECLLDRSTETFKDCVVAKFAVVKDLISSPTAPNILGAEVYERMEKFVNEGEFYVRAELEVAIEGGT